MTAGEAMSVGLRRFPVVLGVAVLLTLGLMLGFMLFVIPGIYLMVKLVFAPIAAVAESKGVLDSFRYSWELVRGRWWRTFLLLTIIGIVAAVLYGLVGIVIGVFVAIVGVAEFEQMQRLPWQIDFIVAPLISGLLMPLFYALLMAIYADCKLRSEGADIAERIAAAEA